MPARQRPLSDAGAASGPLRIRKYANRRLYDQSTSRHLTNDELYALVASGRDVVVIDARTEEEITNSVLAQLLIERDPLKLAAVPTNLLHAFIRTNERILQSAITRHLAAMVEAMAQIQRQAQQGLVGPATPLAAFGAAIDPGGHAGDVAPPLNMMDPTQWMRRFLGATPESDVPREKVAAPRAADDDPDDDGDGSDDLELQIKRLQRQLDALSRRAASEKRAPSESGRSRGAVGKAAKVTSPRSKSTAKRPAKATPTSPSVHPAAKSREREPQGRKQNGPKRR